MKNIVFDVGMVLVDFRWRDYMRDRGFSEDIIELLGDKMINNPLWNELDRGVIEESKVIASFKEELPECSDEIDRFWNNEVELVREFDYAGPMIKGLKKAGYNVYLLSNYPQRMHDLHWPRFSFIEDIDGKVVSALEHMVKPDIEIYELLINRYNLKPGKTVFLDDRRVNVEAAKKTGMQGIVFTSYDNAKAELEKIGVTF